MTSEHQQLISLGWTVDGRTTVVASVVAMLVAMTLGFSAVLMTAGACYVAAWAISSVTSHVS